MEESAGRKRGFASMDWERQKEIARKGRKMAHEKGRAHEFTPEEAREAGRKGGHKVSRNREHMARIGRAGGQARARSVSSLRKSESMTPAQGATAQETNATALSRIFEGLNFPAPRQSVIERLGDANPDVREALMKSEIGEFRSLDHLNEELAKFSPAERTGERAA